MREAEPRAEEYDRLFGKAKPYKGRGKPQNTDVGFVMKR
jgi:hypothetical protein